MKCGNCQRNTIGKAPSIPVVERPGEMLQTQQRTPGADTEAAIRIPLESDIQDLRRSGDVALGRDD